MKLKFIFEIFNLFLLIGGLAWLYRRFRLSRFLEGYRSRVAEEVRRAQELEAEAERLHLLAEEELASAERQVREILEAAERAAEREGEEYRAMAEAEARRLLAQARREVELARTKIYAELQRMAVRELASRAEELLIREMKEEDHRRLVRTFLEGLREESFEFEAVA
ncbi:TPA: hypothetical protein EYP12_05755 [Candidatus Bipolaricaulota bacterium]|nr:hypothetical protein [Candidatus Bipolaricaulota bacterium]